MAENTEQHSTPTQEDVCRAKVCIKFLDDGRLRTRFFGDDNKWYLVSQIDYSGIPSKLSCGNDTKIALWEWLLWVARYLVEAGDQDVFFDVLESIEDRIKKLPNE